MPREAILDTDFAEAVLAVRGSANLNGVGDVVVVIYFEFVLLFLVP